MPSLLCDNNVQIYIARGLITWHTRSSGSKQGTSLGQSMLFKQSGACTCSMLCCLWSHSRRGLPHFQQACHTSSCRCQPCPAKPCAWQCWCPQTDQWQSTPMPGSHPPSDASAAPSDTLDMRSRKRKSKEKKKKLCFSAIMMGARRQQHEALS